jgi:4a-hydroxytetrahydrobiopterin dehydratase
MTTLSEQKCVVCEAGGPALSAHEASLLHAQVPLWTVSEDAKYIERRFTFASYEEVVAFVTKVADIATEEGHHPDITFGYDYVRIHLSTHSVNGLSGNDFIEASKIDLIAG